ncbi:hypothetical protein [Acidilobus sp.]|uniref:hypothetical protein n=1 Tax=Acidilobus sp. TaxID=1872109 RepID=UPI003D08F49F
MGVRESAWPLIRLYDDLLGASGRTVAEAEGERPSIRKVLRGGLTWGPTNGVERQRHAALATAIPF